MTEYKKLQIIKHALKHYVNRPDATGKEIEEEKSVLEQVTKKVDELKEKYGIS
jgi:hypothetical protein